MLLCSQRCPQGHPTFSDRRKCRMPLLGGRDPSTPQGHHPTFSDIFPTVRCRKMLEIQVGGGTYVGVLVVASAFSEVPPRAYPTFSDKWKCRMPLLGGPVPPTRASNISQQLSNIFRQLEMSDALVWGSFRSLWVFVCARSSACEPCFCILRGPPKGISDIF